LVNEHNKNEIEKQLKIKSKSFDYYIIERIMLGQIDGFYPIYGYKFDKFCYGAKTMFESFKIARNIYYIKRIFLPYLHPEIINLEYHELNILKTILYFPKYNWNKGWGCSVYEWLDNIDKWSKARYEYEKNEIINKWKKDLKRNIYVLKLLYDETRKEGEIIKLFAGEFYH